MESGFASPRTDAFPAGLRVLVVDDDPTWLKILEKMLKKCSYEVTTCCLAREALNLLRERKDGFDIVISDVNMPDMDGFKLLEHVGLEMDLPVIMMSVDGETSRVMKGVQHGACDYLLKPVRMKELKNIWQHVFRKRIHEVKDIENYEGGEDIQMMRNGSDKYDDRHLLGGGDLGSAKKRKDMENKEHDDQDTNDPAMKKVRVVWSVDLHQKFVKAVDQIGFDKAGPKKILDLMNVPWLTRENVASHLQKYRLYWSRLHKQNEPKTSYAGIKQPEFTSKDPAASFGLQSSVTMHQNNAASCSFGYSGNEVLIQDVVPRKNEGGLKGNVSFLPVTEPRKALIGDCPDTQKTSNGSQMGFTHPFGSLGLDVDYTSLESIIPQHHSWSREIPMVQFMQQPKLEHQRYGYTHLPVPGPQHHMQADSPRPLAPISAGTSITGSDKARHSEIKPLCTEYRSNHARKSPIGHTTESFSAQAETKIVNLQACGPMSIIAATPSMKNHSLDQNSASNWDSEQQNLIPGSGSALQSSHVDLKLYSLQDYDNIENFGLTNIEILGYHDPELFTELSQSYDSVRFNCDYFCDSMEHPISDQGLFIV